MVRAKATDRENFMRYFEILENTLKKNGIFNNPVRIYNCEVTGVTLNPKRIKVVAKHSSKDVSCISGDDKAQITALVCTCASGVPERGYKCGSIATFGHTSESKEAVRSWISLCLCIGKPFLQIRA